MTFRAGIRIGVDVGRARIGIARSDSEGLVCIPLRTIARNKQSAKAISELAREYEALEVIVGLPVSLSGQETASTIDARKFSESLFAQSQIPVRLVDERLSTVSAQSQLHQIGRSAAQSRSVIDQVAATIILQNALDIERSSGRAPGELLTRNEG